MALCFYENRTKSHFEVTDMKRWFVILLLLLLLLPIAGFIVAAPIPASMISGVTVMHHETGDTHYYALNENEAADLSAGLLNGTKNFIPAEAQDTFELKVHVGRILYIPYHVTVSRDQSVNIRRAGGSAVQSTSPLFFYTHESFTGMHEHAQPPILGIRNFEYLFFPEMSAAEWTYRRSDGSWSGAFPEGYSGAVRAGLISDTETVPVVYAVDAPPALSVDPVPDSISLQVTDPAGNLCFDDLVERLYLPVFAHNGVYRYQLEMNWSDEHVPYRGSYTTSFPLEVKLPPVYEFPISVVQGELVEFRFRHFPQDALPVIEQTISDSIRFYPMDDGHIAYLPTHYGTETGTHTIRYGLEGEPLMAAHITVQPREFRIQHLSIDPSIEAATRNEEAIAQSARYYGPARDVSSPERYYTEPFMIPVRGRLTTEFGQTRYVNNAPTSYRHSGLDIAAPTGTPISAVNRGRVVLSMDLILQGKTVVIDHGQGLFSVYFHLHELYAEADQIVDRGEIIGTVGTTGFSTGPHLHLTMSYYRHNLEPGHFLVGEPITYQNASQHLQ
jgi:hypothetical protein